MKPTFCKTLLATLVVSAGVQANQASEQINVQTAINDELEVINVFGRQPDDVIKNIPQSVTAFSQNTFEIGLFDTVGEVLRLVPNATPSSSQDMFADNVLLRGFDAVKSLNGLGYLQVDHPTDLVNVERIEVLKGPASVLVGQMEPGGTINLVTKQAHDDFLAKANVSYGSENLVRTAIDVNGAIHDNANARINFAYETSDSAMVHLSAERLVFAPNIHVNISEKTALIMEGSYATNEWKALNGGTPMEGTILDNPNGNYAKSFNPSGPEGNTQRDSSFFNARIEHVLNDNLTARASYSYMHNESDWREFAPFGLNDDYRTLDRIIFSGEDTYKKDHNLIIDVNGVIQLGSVKHKYIVGVDIRDGDVYRPTKIHFIEPIDLFEPVYTSLVLDPDNLARDRITEQSDDIKALFIQDRISLNEKWHLLAGARYIDSELTQKNTNNLSGSATDDGINQSDWTTQFGAIYEITDELSIFANRSESFVPQQGTTSGKKPLKAEIGTQYELGLRMSFADLNASLALFDIDKDNIAIEDPLDDDFEVAQGQANSRGIEASIQGYVNSDLYINMSYGYTKSAIIKSDDVELEGKRFSNVPEHTFVLQGRYYVNAIRGLSLGGTLSYIGERYADDENTIELPSHTRIDINTSYQINDNLEVNFVVNNLLDEEIYTPGSFDGLLIEPGRTFLTRINYQF